MIGKPRKYCAPRSVAYPLRVMDWFVDRYAQGRYQHRDLSAPDAVSPRILFMTSGHLGDALILSYIFPMIRQRYPAAIIDVLAGDWCDPIWQTNPYIRRVVYLNHPFTNRKSISLVQKWQRFRATFQSAVARLNDETYDYSIDIRFANSPLHFVLPFIRVKRSIGFGTRGWGGLLDDEFFLPNGEFHHFTMLSDLWKPLGINADVNTITPYFNTAGQSVGSVWAKLNQAPPSGSVALLCPEAGGPEKMLTIGFWLRIAVRVLHDSDATLVFCGQTDFTTSIIDAVQQQHPDQTGRVVSSVGRLTIIDMAVLASSAAFAITLDSLPVHLCSIFCPTVAFFSNGMGLQFFPIAARPTLVLHNHVQSRLLTIERPGFRSEYVTDFDTTTLDRAFAWLARTIATTV